MRQLVFVVQKFYIHLSKICFIEPCSYWLITTKYNMHNVHKEQQRMLFYFENIDKYHGFKLTTAEHLIQI